MYAVIVTGGKQYRVSAGDVLCIEKLEADAGTAITFDQVLLVGGEAGTTIGKPTVAGAQVTAEVVQQGRGEKVTIIKFRRRKHYRRQAGHRQWLTQVRITGINI